MTPRLRDLSALCAKRLRALSSTLRSVEGPLRVIAVLFAVAACGSPNENNTGLRLDRIVIRPVGRGPDGLIIVQRQDMIAVATGRLPCGGTGLYRGQGHVFERMGPEANICEALRNADIVDISPDQVTIAYSKKSDAAAGVFTLNLKTGSERLVFKGCGPAAVMVPAFAPGGHELAVVEVCTGHSSNVVHAVTVESDGMVVREVARIQLAPDEVPAFPSKPAWSPDGHLLAFSIDRSRGEITRSSWMILNLATRAVRSYEGGREPSFSPDGRRIALLENGGNGAIPFALRIRGIDTAIGSAELRIPLRHTATEEASRHDYTGAPVGPIVWASDGASVTFSRNFQDVTSIWTVSLDGTRLQQLCSLPCDSSVQIPNTSRSPSAR
jgi:Tol biopolymer transport system component